LPAFGSSLQPVTSPKSGQDGSASMTAMAFLTWPAGSNAATQGSRSNRAAIAPAKLRQNVGPSIWVGLLL
jgi:hypothetical protein